MTQNRLYCYMFQYPLSQKIIAKLKTNINEIQIFYWK